MRTKVLPQNWNSAPLDDLLVFILGGDWGKDPGYDDPDYVDVRCIRASELREWEREKGGTAALRRVKKSSLASRELKDGDILVEVSGGGPEQPVGRTVLIDKSVLLTNPEIPKICTNFFRLIRPSSEIYPAYLNYYLQHFYKTGKVVKYQAGSNNLRNLKFNDYLTITIPVPPFNEQRRIVAKIEELFSELDKGIESLKTAREQLKVYRQAVLKHAFEGKLIAKWREENKDKLESPEQLLARIQKERETRYQQQLDEWKEAVKAWERKGKEGKKPKKPLKPKKLSEFSCSEKKCFVDLPEGWVWTKIGAIALVGTGVTPLKSNSAFYQNGDIAWVTSSALNELFIRAPSGFVTEKALNETNLRLYQPHTLLVALYGEGKTRGKCSELLIEAAINQAIAAIVLEGVSEKFRNFMKWFLIKNYEEMRLVASGGVQPNLNLGIIENMAIPICTVSEANQIASALDLEFSKIEKLENDISSQLQKCETLRQSILKKAFSGQLVPQDPNDEPASILLERIRAEKAKQVPKPRRKRKPRKAASA